MPGILSQSLALPLLSKIKQLGRSVGGGAVGLTKCRKSIINNL